jgi:hypothetical protein
VRRRSSETRYSDHTVDGIDHDSDRLARDLTAPMCQQPVVCGDKGGVLPNAFADKPSDHGHGHRRDDARTTTMPLAVRNDHTGATVRAVDDVNHITALVHRVARGCRDADHRHQSANSRMSPRRRYW